MSAGVVIIGGGQAGVEAATALRAQGYDKPILLVGAEAQLPYQRPPLSKAYLHGGFDAERLALRAESLYEKQHIDLLLGQTVIDIAAQFQRIRLRSGAVLPYEHLILATGARNRLLQLKGSARALYLRTLPEADAIRERLASATSVAVIGGGFIGLELAAAARKLGKQVCVIEAAPRLMARAASPALSKFFRDLHQQEGVEILLGAAIEEIEETAIRFADGTRRPADVVLAGIGVISNMELAQAAGLAVGNGITVDEYLRTSDPNIFAMGDCAEFPCAFANARAGGRIRLESVQNAVDQAKCIAQNIVGKAQPYRDAPWFWTDQFDVRFQMAGSSSGFDQMIVRGEMADRKFTAFYFKEGRFIAADSVNRFADHIAVRKILQMDKKLTPEQAGDESFELKQI
jgi:3-phenylpropionate/trans-cinnamate dioxygenase ferredoxin reductase component